MDDALIGRMAQELKRRRLLAQDKEYDKDIKTSYAEVTFLSSFNRVPSLDDFYMDKKKLTFVSRDDDNRSIRLVTRHEYPFRVYMNNLNHDVYVFIRTSTRPEDCSVEGWLTLDEVKECPIIEHESYFDEKKKVSCYEITSDYLIKLPEKFSFKEACVHTDSSPAIWDYSVEAWACLQCGRCIANRLERETAIDRPIIDIGELDQILAFKPKS